MYAAKIRIVKRAVYVALGIDMNGRKDVLGMYVGKNENSKFRLSILNDLKNQSVENVLIADRLRVDDLATRLRQSRPFIHRQKSNSISSMRPVVIYFEKRLEKRNL